MTTTPQRIRLLTPAEHRHASGAAALAISNDEALEPLAAQIEQASRIDLHFPAFTDGRAYSQAYLLRKRFGFAGDLRATGDVLVDQLLLMARTGFSSAVLKHAADMASAQRQFEHFPGFYQRDAGSEAPALPRGTMSGD